MFCDSFSGKNARESVFEATKKFLFPNFLEIRLIGQSNGHKIFPIEPGTHRASKIKCHRPSDRCKNSILKKKLRKTCLKFKKKTIFLQLYGLAIQKTAPMSTPWVKHSSPDPQKSLETHFYIISSNFGEIFIDRKKKSAKRVPKEKSFLVKKKIFLKVVQNAAKIICSKLGNEFFFREIFRTFTKGRPKEDWNFLMQKKYFFFEKLFRMPQKWFWATLGKQISCR